MSERKHAHYFKPCPYSEIDVYRTLEIFSITDQAIGHAVKKLLLAGERGVKNKPRDVRECVDTLLRWLEMRTEDCLLVHSDFGQTGETEQEHF